MRARCAGRHPISAGISAAPKKIVPERGECRSMRSILYAAGIAAALAFPAASQAQNRYAEPPPIVVSPDLSAPWVMQLRQVQTAAVAPRSVPAPEPALDPKFLPQEVSYDGPHGPGTIVIDTSERLLYLVLEGGKARRYGVGVGKEGFSWKGTEKITQKREWPDWRPPAEMIAREKKKGKILAARRTRSAPARSISAPRSTASTAPTRPGRSGRRFPPAASACATKM
jgi:lipoprotein-anchoring transpeptidase ErfK/SrfK